MNIACTICLDRFFLSSTISALPCGHLFHDSCLDRWLIDERKKTCPQCRMSITPKQVIKKLYLMEPLCQTQLPAGGQDTSELLQKLECQEGKVLEAEQRCRKALSDLQKTEERRKAFETDTVNLRKQLTEQTAKYQRMINERDAKLNMLVEQYKHVDLSNKKEEQIKALQAKLAEYRNIDLIYKGHANTFKAELQKMIGSCHTVQDKDRIIEELIRYNVILKEEHSKMNDDKQDLIRNLDRITAQCEKMQLEKRQAIKKQNNNTDQTKQELASVRQQLQSAEARIEHLESLLARTATKENSAPVTTIDEDDETSNDTEDADSNMIDLTDVPDPSSVSTSTSFSTQHFSNSSLAIDVLHSIIQETSSLDLPLMKKQKVRRLDDEHDEQQQDYLVRPLVTNKTNFQRSFDKYGGHAIPFPRRISNQQSFKSKSRLSKTRPTSTRNNHKITSFFA